MSSSSSPTRSILLLSSSGEGTESSRVSCALGGIVATCEGAAQRACRRLRTAEDSGKLPRRGGASRKVRKTREMRAPSFCRLAKSFSPRCTRKAAVAVRPAATQAPSGAKPPCPSPCRSAAARRRSTRRQVPPPRRTAPQPKFAQKSARTSLTRSSAPTQRRARRSTRRGSRRGSRSSSGRRVRGATTRSSRAGRPRHAGSPAFKSKSMRGKDAVVDGKGDPGAYNPMEGRELASDAGTLAQQVGADRVGRVWLEGEARHADGVERHAGCRFV